jgi:hypothetical protein
MARSFYQANTSWSDSKINSHLRGIDFRKPVSVVDLSQGKTLAQYQLPGGHRGNYFTEIGAPANKLGIYTSGLTENRYTVPQSVQALRSTAASVIDDWSVDG